MSRRFVCEIIPYTKYFPTFLMFHFCPHICSLYFTQKTPPVTQAVYIVFLPAANVPPNCLPGKKTPFPVPVVTPQKYLR